MGNVRRRIVRPYVLGLFLLVAACEGPSPFRDADPGGGGPAVRADGAGARCGVEATPIAAVQGAGERSPLEGRRVVVEGVVVGDFGGGAFADLDGFYVQEEPADRDDDPATSEGLFVYAPGGRDVEEGRVVRVEGRVREYEGLTELVDVEGIAPCGRAEVGAIDLTLPAGTAALEALEGMRVRLPQELVIADAAGFGRYGELVLALPLEGRDRPFQPTAHAPPGPATEALDRALARHRLVLDDGRSVRDPRPARHPNGEPFTLRNRFRGGDVVTGVVGILDDRFGRYRIQPTRGATHQVRNPRPEVPRVGGELRVASFNVLNYFTTLGERGARDAAAFERQRAKIVAALEALDADVVGLVEIENRPEALADLVAALNDAAGAGAYAALRTGPIGGDAIRVALIYDPAVVAPVGPPAVLDDRGFVDPAGTGAPRNRPALAQTFERREDGARFTVAVAHLKSKGSACGAGDDDPLQGNCARTRALAAEALLDWIAADPTGAGDPDRLLLGDLNAYDEEDPVRVLTAGPDGRPGGGDGLVDLLEAYGGEYVYSYAFDGAVGHLDYALATPSLAAQVTGAAVWHVNADEPDLLAYDAPSAPRGRAGALYAPDPFRSSDHDPVVVGIDPDPTADGGR